MKIKIVSIIIISIIILNILITGWNFHLKANRVSDDDYDWGHIEVISEPIKVHNSNVGDSENTKVVVVDDKIYMVWEDSNNTNGAGTDNDIFYKYFDGNIWSELQIISEPIPFGNNNTGNSYDPHIAVDNGKIYVVWSDRNNTIGSQTDYDIFYRSNLTGSGWEDIQVISEPVQGKNFNTKVSSNPSIAVENGKIYVVWDDFNNTNNASDTDRDVFYRCNLPGSGWGDIQVISEPAQGKNFNTGGSYEPVIAVENDKIYVVWFDFNNTNGAGYDTDIFYKCNLTGSGWEAVQVISEPVQGKNFSVGDSLNPAIAVENSYIYVVWADGNNTNNASDTDSDIFFRWNYSGSGWEDIQVISEPAQGKNFNIGDSLNPAISVDNGKIYIVWDDNNNTNGAGETDSDIFYRSKLTWSGWEDVQIISEPISGRDKNTGSSYNPDIAVSIGKSHIVWSDKTNMNKAGKDSDIFYRWCFFLPLDLSRTKVTPSSGNTSTNFNFTVTYVHEDNIAPEEIIMNISGINYPMLEVDSGDTNYSDGKSYYQNITHLNIGPNICKFQAFDGLFYTSTFLINDPIVYNTPPNITTKNNLTAIENTYYEISYEYEDIDTVNVGQPGNWEFSTDADWLTFNTTTATLNGTPTNDDVGKHWVNITINDMIDIDFTNFTLTVENINDPPLIITEDVINATEDEYYEVDYKAKDIDNRQDELNWSIATNAEWLAFNTTTATLSGIPTDDDIGEYWVNITVNDTMYIDFTNFTLTVIGVNDPPIIITEDILATRVNKLYIVEYDAIDIDSPLSNLIWSLQTNASWLKFSQTTNALGGTPTLSDLGWYNVNVSVEDGDGGLDWHKFVLTILPENTPPKITTIDAVTLSANILYFVDYEAIDDLTPPDQLLWSLATNASWLSIKTDTGILSGTATLSDVGWFSVTVSVSDEEGGVDFHDFILTVYSTPNQPPTIITEAQLTATVDVLYSVDYEATDDRTPSEYLQWGLDTKALWLSVDPNTGLLSGTPRFNHVGWYRVNISITDGEYGWDFQEFILIVTKEPIVMNNAPELSEPKISPSEGDTETEFTFSVYYFDADHEIPEFIQLIIDNITYDLELKDDELNAFEGIYEYKLKLTEGKHTYYFKASDGLDTAITNSSTTSLITKPDDNVFEELSSGPWLNIIILLIIIIIIIILITIFLIIRAKKKKLSEESKEKHEDEPEEELEDEPEEELEDEPEEELEDELPPPPSQKVKKKPLVKVKGDKAISVPSESPSPTVKAPPSIKPSAQPPIQPKPIKHPTVKRQKDLSVATKRLKPEPNKPPTAIKLEDLPEAIKRPKTKPLKHPTVEKQKVIPVATKRLQQKARERPKQHLTEEKKSLEK